MRQGQRLAAEQQYRRPRSFEELTRQDPDLRALARRAVQHRRSADRWARFERIATGVVVGGVLLLVAVILWPFVMRAL